MRALHGVGLVSNQEPLALRLIGLDGLKAVDEQPCGSFDGLCSEVLKDFLSDDA